MESANQDLMSELTAINEYLWNNPELAFEEYKAHDCLTDFLEKSGFNVTKNYILKTGFKAEFGSGQPHAVVFSEFDALPGLGHACGHNLIAIVGIYTFVVAARLLKERNISGKLTLLGSPAEEGGGGKEIMIKAGAINNADFAVMAHPNFLNAVYPKLVARQSLTANFKGFSCHATRPWNGRNALDAAVLAYTNCNALRHAMKPNWRMHGIFSKGGEKPNIVPSEAELYFYVRAPTGSELTILTEKIEKCFEAAASALECDVEVTHISLYQNVITNAIIAKVFSKYYIESGEQLFDEVTHPYMGGSTDFGNVTHTIPGIHPYFDIRTDSIPHSVGFVDATHTEKATTAAFNIANCLSKTVIEILSDSDLLKSVKEDFQKQLQLED